MVAGSKVSQGENFMDSIKKGDYFFLCYGNSIRFLGQFTSDKAILNPEMEDGWYEREYRVIAKSKDTAPYSGAHKWWPPDFNSTCIKIEKDDQPLFESEILQPYFDMTLNKLFGDTDPDMKYWWLTANPKIWSFTDLKVGDIVIGYEANPVKKVVALAKITQANDGKSIYFEKTEGLTSPIEYLDLKACPELEKMEFFVQANGSLFKLTGGIFYRFCQTAANHPDKEFFFIIDEINRGNMSKIFGELLMLIEKDYRGTKATLAYSGMSFSVPENLFIIGMMNTADRSLAMIDYALRRRFSFFEMEPGFNSEGFTKYQNGFANETFNALIDQIKALNKEITDDKSPGRGFQIGHSYFCGREEAGCTDEWMRSVVEFDILPMLGEYWFDEPDKLSRWEKNLRGVFDD